MSHIIVSYVNFRNFACICSNIFMCGINIFKYHVLQFAFFNYYILDRFSITVQIVPLITIQRLCHHLYNLSLINRHLSCLIFCYDNNAITNILAFTHLLIHQYLLTSMCDMLWEGEGIHI